MYGLEQNECVSLQDEHGCVHLEYAGRCAHLRLHLPAVCMYSVIGAVRAHLVCVCVPVHTDSFAHTGSMCGCACAPWKGAASASADNPILGPRHGRQQWWGTDLRQLSEQLRDLSQLRLRRRP